MKYRMLVIALVASSLCSQSFSDDDEKLDEPLKQLRDFQRGTISTELVTERHISRWDLTFGASIIPIQRKITFLDDSFDVPTRIMPQLNSDVKDVLRLQFESPTTLLNGIREREQQLRDRTFLPEAW